MSKTPWNPSKRATKRVKNPLPIPDECNCCNDFETGRPTEGCISIVNNSEIYGREYGEWPWAVMCGVCGAYVGLHPFTGIPLGTLADGPLRQARKKYKAAFTMLHTSGLMSRYDAYERLSEKLGIDKGECHFGWFDFDMCKKAGEASLDIYSANN